MVAQIHVMRLNSQTHPRQTSPCASIPRHTTLVYEVNVIQQDRLGCRDPDIYATFEMAGATNFRCYNIVILTLSAGSMQWNTCIFSKWVEALGVGYFIMTSYSHLCECYQISCPAQDPLLLHSVMQQSRTPWRMRSVDDCFPR